MQLIRANGFFGPITEVSVSTGMFTSTRIPLKDIKAIEILGEKTEVVRRGVGRGAGAIAGGLVLGPVGMLAGSIIVTGKQKSHQGTGVLRSVLRTYSGRSYAVNCTLKQAQEISAAIITPEEVGVRPSASMSPKPPTDTAMVVTRQDRLLAACVLAGLCLFGLWAILPSFGLALVCTIGIAVIAIWQESQA